MSFLEDFEKTLKDKCYQDDPPYCQSACPFFMDIKALEDKWKKGRFNAAYRVFQTASAFPAIVAEICDHPCEKACIRNRIDGPVAVNLLEKATIDFARRKTPNNFNMPSRGKTVAVIGGGLSGLSCALRLSNNKYEVTLYEASDVLGGQGRTMMDPDAFDAEIKNQFQFEKTQFRTGERITSLKEIRDAYDAVYIATGEGGERFGLAPSDRGAFATEEDGVFMGGGILGRTPVEALADGIRAAVAMEKYLKTGLMNEPVPNTKTRIRMRMEDLEETTPVHPASGDRFTEEEAVAEIARCIRCSCDNCIKACDILRLKAKTPKRIHEEVYITIRPGTLSRDGTWATRLISTCNQCGLCKEVCPQHIDLGGFFADAMKAMHEKGAMPWAFHDFWLRDMEFSTGDTYVCRMPEGTEKCTYAFFTGCQLGASDPRYVTESYGWLRNHYPDTALWMTCCGAPAEWAGDVKLHEVYLEKIRKEWDMLGRPTVVFACPSCRKLFDKCLPEIPGVFLTELMAKAPDRIRDEKTQQKFHLFDACAGREHPELAESVRDLLRKEEIDYEEPEYGAKEARCCGYGGHIGIAAPNFTGVVQKERAAESELPYAAYCVNCREAFAGKGHEALHILDLLFDLNDQGREMLTVSKKRDNRRAAKRAVLKEFWNEELPMEERIDLEIGAELEKKMSMRQILNEDMEKVVEYLEKEQRGVLDPETGTITGHLKIGNMTYWAEYIKKPEGGFVLVNGYAHRMNLEGE